MPRMTLLLLSDASTTGYNNHQQGALRAALDAYLGAVASQNGSGSGSQGTGVSGYPANLNPGYPGSNPYAARETAFNTLVSLWTGTDGIDSTATTGAANARHMAVLEKVYGGRYQNANADQASVWETTYRRLAETYYGSLAAQTHFKARTTIVRPQCKNSHAIRRRLRRVDASQFVVRNFFEDETKRKHIWRTPCPI